MADLITPELPVLKRKDFSSDQDVRWCPGCGDYAILAQMQKILPELEIPKENIVFISGIGCSSRFPYYMDTYGIHSIHGRAPTLASGLKLARPDLTVFVITGDGDSLSIGGNHLIHVLRRNVNVNIILFNNRIYGLTKGQFSPTSLAGHKTKSSPMGSISQPLNPLTVALAAEGTFVARSIDVETKHLQATLKEAAAHKGASFVEVLQNCNIFNDGAWKFATDSESKGDSVLHLEHGKPMVFGAENNKGIRADGLQLEVVELGNDWTVDDLLVHDAHSNWCTLALALSRMSHPEFPIPIGVLRDIQKPVYEEGMLAQVDRAKEVKGDGDLTKLYFAADVWTVGEKAESQSRNGSAAKVEVDSELFDGLMAGWTDSLMQVQKDMALTALSALNQGAPVIAKETDSLASVIERMKKDVRCACIVNEQGVLTGMFTDQEVLNIALLVEDANSVEIQRCMNTKPATMHQDKPVIRALAQLAVQESRYLVLVDDEGRPTGCLGSNELVDFISKIHS